MLSRRELDQLVLDVEFILISVVQGVALTTLAVEAISALRSPHSGAYLLIAAGLLSVLIFWSAALIHAISFISWPMDLIHYFFYFALALLECLTFAQIDHPRGWFGFSSACYGLSLVLYAYDYVLIVRRRPSFGGSDEERALYRHIVARHRLEMLVFVPSGLVFNFGAYVFLGGLPGAANLLAVLQILMSLAFIVTLVRSFSQRQLLITNLAHED
jgi:hypothetical protein